MNSDRKVLKPWQRLIIALGLPALAVMVCLLVYKGVRISCFFYELTGLYCPGCGSGRVLLNIFAGDIAAAFKSNVMLFILGIPAAIVVLHEYIRLIFPALGLRPVHLSQQAAYFCLILICAFWVLRNIPLFAFLAP